MKKMMLLVIFMAVVCGAGVVSGQSKGELVVCQGAEVNSLDPARHNSVTDTNYGIQVFDMLYYRDEQGIAKPRLALSHKLINATTWQFKLRTGVKFHNGAEMTAKDVKFSIDRMIDPQTKAFFAPFWKIIKEVKVINNSTIQITTSAPDPLLLKRLSYSLFIMPSDLFKEKGAEAFFQHPVGTGPFRFVSWARNDRMVLEANEAYWDGVPKMKRIIIRALPETATRLAELQTGNADIITSIPPFLVPKVKAYSGATVQSIPSGRIMFLYINCKAKGPLQDKRVRQALNYAVDRKTIINNVLSGSAVEMAVNLTPYHFGYDPALKPYPYDPAKAKKLLSEAGYAKGLKLVFNSPNGRYQLDKEVSEAIAGMFRAVGIEVDMNIREWGTYTQMLVQNRLQDIGFIGWGNMLHDADGTLQPYFTPDSAFSYYNTPALAEKINKARTTMDEKKRLELYKEIQRDIYEAAPLVFLYQQIDHYGVSNKVSNFKVRGDEHLVLYKVSK